MRNSRVQIDRLKRNCTLAVRTFTCQTLRAAWIAYSSRLGSEEILSGQVDTARETAATRHSPVVRHSRAAMLNYGLCQAREDRGRL